MEGLSGFVLLLIMAVVLLLGDLLQRARKRASHLPEPVEVSDEEQPPRGASETAPAEARPRRPKARLASRPERRPGMGSIIPPSAVHIPARHLVAGRENLRRAVIVMTVLGTPVSERPGSAPPRSVTE
jgi:hypothetical protein